MRSAVQAGKRPTFDVLMGIARRKNGQSLAEEPQKGNSPGGKAGVGIAQWQSHRKGIALAAEPRSLDDLSVSI